MQIHKASELGPQKKCRPPEPIGSTRTMASIDPNALAPIDKMVASAIFRSILGCFGLESGRYCRRDSSRVAIRAIRVRSPPRRRSIEGPWRQAARFYGRTSWMLTSRRGAQLRPRHDWRFWTATGSIARHSFVPWEPSSYRALEPPACLRRRVHFLLPATILPRRDPCGTS